MQESRDCFGSSIVSTSPNRIGLNEDFFSETSTCNNFLRRNCFRQFNQSASAVVGAEKSFNESIVRPDNNVRMPKPAFKPALSDISDIESKIRANGVFILSNSSCIVDEFLKYFSKSSGI
uniref:Uncharacterized protein n=1 Tax=Romanomermis culicivorax TaxID=13658 RepID=A0A915JMS2_ROMCU